MAEKKVILIADKMDKSAIERIEKDAVVIFREDNPTLTKEELEDAIEKHKPDVVFLRSAEVTEKAAASAKKGTVFLRGGAGTNNLKAAKEAGHEVQNTPGANALGVIDLAAGFVGELLLKEKLPPAPAGKPTIPLEVFSKIIAERKMRECNTDYHGGGKGDGSNKAETLAPDVMELLRRDRIPELEGKNILLTGATGSTGKLMVELAQALGMNVIAVKGRKMTEKYAAENNIRLVETLEDGFREADIVSLHTELVKDGPTPTAGMIKQEHFDMLKPTAVVINGARAELIAKGVKTKIPVAIDDERKNVELINPQGIENLTVTVPKIGAKTKESEKRVGVMALEQIIRVINNEPPLPERVVSPSAGVKTIERAVDLSPQPKKVAGE